MILIEMLNKYRQKRNFKQTPEPKGSGVVKENRILRFVIHKHKASHLHYDLRLESGGVLKSWAIPKGPSLNPGEKRLAMMVEDHPFEYRNFEGVIPKGNYGAGNVIIWDEGNYTLRNPAIDFDLSIAEGKITFVLNGKKLMGEFALVKTGKADNSWLLIKKKDEYAKTEDVTLNGRSVKSGLNIEEVGASGLIGAKKSRMPLNLKPMLAVLSGEPFSREGWLFEIKWDGYRAMSWIKDKKVNIYSRNGLSFNEKFPMVAESLGKMGHEAILDGEITALNKEGKPDFQQMQNYLNNREANIVYYIFDLLYLNGHDLRDLPLHNRKEILQKYIEEDDIIKISGYIEKDGVSFFKAAEKEGMEGIVAKNSESRYYVGRRSAEWLKIKISKRQEAVIAGFTEPRGSRKFFGSLVLGVYDGGDLVYIGHSGGGFDYSGQEKLHNKLQKLATNKCPFLNRPDTNMPVTWVRPKLVCEVKFSEWTSGGLMRQPIFLGLREDKTAKDVKREHNKKDVFIPSPKTRTEKINGRDVAITNQDKIYWPKEKFTKGDMVDYYKSISKLILPYLKDRPESLNRHPDGIDGESFFHKDMDKIPEWVETVSIFSESNKKNINYLLCQNKETLLYMANLGCIEINPWFSRIGNLDNPDYLVIDLDPLEADFETVIETALTTNEVLEKIGAKNLCKTSGATGMHIFIPLGGAYSYNESKAFAELIVNAVHKKIPAITSIKRDPKLRRGKVYLDYLQNRKGQTITAPYSLRPREGVPVSTPLAWEEVKKGLDPADFNAKTIFARLNKAGDIMKPILQKGINMKKCLGKLEKIN